MDTGAVDNICGSVWVDEVSKYLPEGLQVGWTELPRPHPVTGVGNDTVHARWRVQVPIGLPGGPVTIYDALYIEDNNTPGLLGTSAMQQTGTIIDLRRDQMRIYSGDTSGIRIDTSRANSYSDFNLIQTQQGHILLPCTMYSETQTSRSSSSSS